MPTLPINGQPLPSDVPLFQVVRRFDHQEDAWVVDSIFTKAEDAQARVAALDADPALNPDNHIEELPMAMIKRELVLDTLGPLGKVLEPLLQQAPR